MTSGLRDIQEKIRIGDVVETVMGVGVVTHISDPAREGDYPMVEIDLGRKWVSLRQVRAIRRHEGDEPETRWQWDEHD